MKLIPMIKCDLDMLYKIRNEHFDENKQYVKKFNLILNETNVIQLINDIEKRLKPSDNSDFKAHKSSPKDCSNCKHDGECSYDMHKEYEKGGCPNYDEV